MASARTGTTLIDEAPLGAVALKIAALCALVIGFDGFDAQALSFAAPTLSRVWHLTPGALGPVFGAALLGMLIGALLLGSLADRFGRKRMILLGTLVFGLGALATLTAANLQSLMVIRFLTGLGLGGVLPNAVALTSEFSPPRHRTLLVMVMFSSITIGSALGGVAASCLIPRFGWAGVFAVGGALPLCFLPLLISALPESLPLESERSAFALPHLFRQRRLAVTLLFWGLFFLNLLDIYFLNSWLPSLFNAAGLSLGLSILVTVMFQLGGTIGSFLLGWLIARLGFFTVLVANFLIGGGAILALGWGGAILAILIPAAFLAGGCVIGGQGGCNALAAAYYPASIRATGMGWALGIGRFGSIAGPVLGGAMLAAHWKVPALLSASALPQVCAALLTLCIGLLAGWRLGARDAETL